MPKSIFYAESTDTRATTDKNDPFLNMGFKHGKNGWTKNGANAIWGSGVELKIPKVVRSRQTHVRDDWVCIMSFTRSCDKWCGLPGVRVGEERHPAHQV